MRCSNINSLIRGNFCGVCLMSGRLAPDGAVCSLHHIYYWLMISIRQVYSPKYTHTHTISSGLKIRFTVKSCVTVGPKYCVVIPVIAVEYILAEIGFSAECSWWSLCVCVCQCACVCALTAGHCLAPSLWNCERAVAHPGRWVAIHSEIGNPTSEKRRNTKRPTLKMRRVKRMFSSAIMSRRHCLGSCYLLFSCFPSLSAGSGEVLP